MNIPEEVRSQFADYPFGPPCTEAEIRKAEAALGESLPEMLVELYLAFDGFLGPTNAEFMWRLFANDERTSGLVEMNQFLRGDDLFPQHLISQCLFFGDNGCGPYWGTKRDLIGKVIQWDAEWGDDFEVVGDTLLEVWLREKQMYDALAQRDPHGD
jgi:hypothetical protein